MNKLAIICIDDDVAILSSLEMEIKNIFGNSYIIELAENGNDAIEICNELSKEATEIALVISDYIMPDMKGDELLKYIHQLSPKTVNIMLTGQADLEAISKAITQDNLYQYIAKPWQVEKLQLMLVNALHNYNQNIKLTDYYNDLANRTKKRLQEIQETNQVILELNQDKDKVFNFFR
ncbi:MAG: response regulator [Candidatus Marithrix sp.]